MGTENVIWWKILLIFDCISRKPFFCLNVPPNHVFVKMDIDFYILLY